MSAERKPQTEPSLLSGPLGLLTALVVRFPVPTVALAIAAALFALGLSGTRLGFRTSRLDLLNTENNYNRLWIEYINEFGDEDDVVVVVEGANRESIVPVLEEISTALQREQRLFHAVLHEVDLSKIRAKGLHYLTPDELLGIEGFLDKVEPIVHGQWSRLKLGTMAAGMSARLQQAETTPPNAAARAEIARLSESLLTATADDGQYESPWPEMSCSIATISELSSEYLLTNEGRLGCVLLRLGADDGDSFAKGSRAIDALRDLIAQAEARHPEVNVGLTGLPVMENDEMRASQKSMMEASLLSLVGVVLLFIAGFGGVRHPLMTVGALLLAMAWSFGYITLAVGHLNILSISFGVILIGLGIDFGVHYVARYLQLSAQSLPRLRRSNETLVQTSRSVGPGILTGALTTAIAFFAAGLTEFTGIAELGIIAG
ncbi:MAG TPA: MMPL family transporter, partial [Thermoguttaceae bacterium]|nr:MMPL family transporter [Thermoguttaceae bacterium]